MSLGGKRNKTASRWWSSTDGENWLSAVKNRLGERAFGRDSRAPAKPGLRNSR